MHGVARVMTKGYSEQRNRELRRKQPRTRQADPNAERRLIHDLAQMGLGHATHDGPSKDGPLMN